MERMMHLFRHGTPEAFELELERVEPDALRGLRVADVRP